jgi:hypothetical protein
LLQFASQLWSSSAVRASSFKAAATCAAMQVSRMGKSVVVVDPGTHIGGLTTGGLSWTDIGNKQVIGGIAREFYRKVKAHYDKPESWKFQPREAYYTLRHAEINAADDAMWTFEPHVATAIYQELIAQYKIPVIMKQRLDLRPGKGVIKNGTRITAIVMLLVAAAAVSAWLITVANIPGQVVSLLQPLLSSPTLLLVGIMVLVMIVGTALDMTPTILILTPILMPIIKQAGIDPVYFGVLIWLGLYLRDARLRALVPLRT